MHALEQDQHLLQSVLQPARLDVDILHVWPVAHHPHDAHGKALGKHAVVAGSVKPFAHLHLLLVLHVLHFAVAVPGPLSVPRTWFFCEITPAAKSGR